MVFLNLFHRPFELKWCNVSFLAWKSRAVCDGLIALSTAARHVQRQRFCVDARKKIEMFSLLRAKYC